jgi:hypothetical protein
MEHSMDMPRWGNVDSAKAMTPEEMEMDAAFEAYELAEQGERARSQEELAWLNNPEKIQDVPLPAPTVRVSLETLVRVLAHEGYQRGYRRRWELSKYITNDRRWPNTPTAAQSDSIYDAVREQLADVRKKSVRGAMARLTGLPGYFLRPDGLTVVGPRGDLKPAVSRGEDKYRIRVKGRQRAFTLGQLRKLAEE